MASHLVLDRDLNLVLFEGNSCVRKVTLNRPRHLNSLTYEMVIQMERALKDYERDSNVKLVILKGRGKAFCAGGDVVRIVQLTATGHWSFAGAFYKKQLTLDYLLGTYKKLVVSLVDGIIMGGGVGLAINARFRVVTENTVFAMPEASIGHFPDVGASYFLSRLPGHFGEYLGLIGARIGGTEMLACGLATHFVLSKDLQSLENAIHEVHYVDTSNIAAVIDKFTHTAHVNKDSFYKRLEIINKCFSKNTVEEILSSLENEVAYGADKWIVKAISSMKSASPTSLKIFLRSIREGRMQTLEHCLAREYTMSCHILRGTVNSDIFEGSRASFFDKGKSPKWEPSCLEQVTTEMVNQYFTKVEDDFWVDLELQESRNAPNMVKSKL